MIKSLRVNFTKTFHPQTYPHSEEFDTVIKDDEETTDESEKELSLEQELELAKTKKKIQQTKIQYGESAISKTIRREIDLFEDEGFRDNLVALHFKYDFWHRTATAGSDVVQSGRPIFDDFFQHLWPYIGNNTANVVFQMVKRLWLIRIDQ
ncbi:adhesion G protein-coupled receptor B2 [Trichonephila clavipes]|uniref:Adhesion G protein-coupled receptor B2 n=1 Tax=Trichonephila clavipes TaxID=2585209 RepID=A0A8X6VQR7_TRICX|nr:adhesion G protein-coupled receptor B2 [Trichonephila clavipes]